MHLLITAGGTREYIDPVRFISNASSGRMGYALAAAALKAGHKVTLISAAANLQPPRGVKVISVRTSAEMFAAVKRHFDKCQCLIMAAAVSDYTPVKQAKTKIKKTARLLTLKLKLTVDIIKWAAAHKRTTGKEQIIVGFALEDKNLRANAEKKLKEKNLDMVIANTPASIGSEKSTVWIKTQHSAWIKLENTPKAAIAKTIIALAEKLPA